MESQKLLIISLAMPDGFGNRVNTAPMRVGETKEQYLRRVAVPEINLDNKPRSYYADIFTNLDRTQRAILDGLGLLKDGKPIVGFAGALYTKRMLCLVKMVRLITFLG